MDLFGLIIQQTIAGLSDQYVSKDLIALRNTKEILDSTTDERMVATKLSNQSDVYAVQLTKNFRVYSLIVTNVSDFVGGAGFYAIRLFAPKIYPLDNFERILDELNKQYLNYRSNSITKDTQDYTEILSSIMSIENNKQDFVCLKGKGEAFFYFDTSNTELATKINSKGAYLVHKVYAFNKEKAVQPSVAKSLGLEEFQDHPAAQREITIYNNQLLLNELNINGQIISFNQNSREFIILCRDNDVVTYKTSGGQHVTITGTQHTIAKKYVPPPKPVIPRGDPGEPKIPASVFFIVIGLMVVMLGVGIWYLLRDNGQEYPNGLDAETVVNELAIPDNKTIQHISYIRDSTSLDSVIYKTDYPGLVKFRFYVDSNGWYFKKMGGQNKYKPFGEKAISEISSSANLDSTQKKEFVKELAKISGHPVIEDYTINTEPIPKNGSSINNKSPVKSNEAKSTGEKNTPLKKKNDSNTEKVDTTKV